MMMNSSSGFCMKLLVISRFTKKDLPEPGMPSTNPMGVDSFLRLSMIRLPESLFWP